MGDFKPADLFVGVIQLFAILLPGAVLAAAVMIVIGHTKIVAFAPMLESKEAGWVAFLIASYALGAFIFPLASTLDHGADALIKLWRNWRKRRGKDRDHAFRHADALRLTAFANLSPTDEDPMNTFSWAKSVLLLRAPKAFGDVQGLEAESKFFRSLGVVLILTAILFDQVGRHGTPGADRWVAVIALVLAALSLQRYVARRRTSVEWACKYVVALERISPRS